MNEYLVYSRQEHIQHEARVAHLEEYNWLVLWQKMLHLVKPRPQPIALISADAACPCLF